MKAFKLLVAAIALVTMVACGGGSSPSDVAVKFTELTEKGDIKAALDLTTMPKEQKEQMIPMLDEKVKQSVEQTTQNKGGFKSAAAIEETIAEDGASAKVKVETTYGDGSTDSETVEVINVDGKWMIPNPMDGK